MDLEPGPDGTGKVPLILPGFGAAIGGLNPKNARSWAMIIPGQVVGPVKFLESVVLFPRDSFQVQKMRFSAMSVFVLSATLGAASASHAAVYSYSLPNSVVDSTGSAGTLNTAGAGGKVRAFYFTGEWSENFGDPYANEFRVRLPGVTTLGNGPLDRKMGGPAAEAPYTFVGPDTTTWENNVTVPADRAAEGHLADGALMLGGMVDYRLRQTLSGSVSNISNAQLHFLTDIITPETIVLNGASPVMTQRPTSFSTLSMSGSYRYQPYSFTALATGIHHIGLYTGNPDGYLYVYNGSFDPGNTLMNLIGMDDTGDLDGDKSSGMYLNLVAGQSITVITSNYFSNDIMPNGLMTIAGPVPEPGTRRPLASAWWRSCADVTQARKPNRRPRIDDDRP